MSGAGAQSDGGMGDRLARLEAIAAVNELMASYHRACDGWDGAGTHRDPQAIAGHFVPNGRWIMPGQDPVVGRAAIADKCLELRLAEWILHFVANPLLTFDGTAVRGEMKGFVKVRRSGNPTPFWMIGLYVIDAVATPDGWRFRTLEWQHIDGELPADL